MTFFRHGALGGAAWVVLALCTTPARADVRLAVVDLERVLEGFERYQKQAEALKSRKDELQEIVDRQEEEVIRLLDELDRLEAGSASGEAEARRTEVEERDRVLREFVRQTNRAFQRELLALQGTTRDQVETAVRRVAESQDIDLVIEKNLALFFEPDLDITEHVLTRLNLLYPPDASLPQPLSDITPPTFPPAPEPAREP